MRILIAILLFPALALSQTYFEKITTGPVATTVNNSHSAAWGDYDNDGDQDLVISSFNHLCLACTFPILFYKNNGDGTFTRILDNEIATLITRTSGLAWGDYDNDGRLDLFLCGTDNSKNILFHNEGNGHFTQILSGIIVNEVSFSQDCAWIDYDKDGLIDLFVTNANNGRNFLYKNTGGGNFIKITTGSIVNDLAVSSGCAIGDYDNDGWPDVFVVNRDAQNDFLYHNNGDGTFTRILNSPMVNDGQYGLAGQWTDVNNDGLIDMIVTNDPGIKLYINNGGGVFTPTVTALNQTPNAYGVNCTDFNNDGRIDIVFATYFGKSYLFKNNGGLSFTRDTSEIINKEGIGGLYGAWADYNSNGKMDLIITATVLAPLNYFYNNTGPTGNYLTLKLTGCTSNRAAIGAKISIYRNGFLGMRVVSPGGSKSGDMLLPHFGLGSNDILDSIVVKWPYPNSTTVLRNQNVNRILQINECGNLCPIARVLPLQPMTVVAGECRTDTINFDSPETGQITNIIALTGGLVNLVTSITPGNTARIILNFCPGISQVGIHPIRLGAYDNADPPCTTYVDISYQVDAALPVELISFTSIVSRRNVTLNWITAKEINNSGFKIERSSSENVEWIQVGFVTGNNTTHNNSVYSFTDADLSPGVYKYRLKQIDFNGNFNYYALANDVLIGTPEKFSLSQNYPNPFNPSTVINFDIPEDGNVAVKIFDVSGKEMMTLVNEFRNAGFHNVLFDGSSFPSGVYYYKLETQNFSAVKKMMLLK